MDLWNKNRTQGENIKGKIAGLIKQKDDYGNTTHTITIITTERPEIHKIKMKEVKK